MQKTFVYGPQFIAPSATHKDDSGIVGQVVYTEPRRVWNQRTLLFLNDDGSRDMNIDGTSGGTPDNIHDGTDNAYWTASDVIGTKMTANSGDRAYDGTLSVKVDNPKLNDVWEFDKGSDVTLSSYTSISMWVNVDKDWSAGDSVSIYGWDSGTGLVVGVEVFLENYINEFDTDVWQKANIPLSDLDLASGTIDGLRMSLVSKGAGKAPKFYLDLIMINETAGVEFTAKPDQGKLFSYDRIELYLEDALDISVNNGTAPGLSLTQLLGITPTIGFAFQRLEAGVPQISLTFKTLSDLNSLTFRVVDVGCDGTNTFLKLESKLPEASVLNELNGDKVVITINDDFTGLLNFRALLIGKELVKNGYNT